MFEKARHYDDFGKFCEIRQKSLDALKPDEECVGELECVRTGPCAAERKSLDDYCGPAEYQCKLYFTKQGSIPDEYEALLEAAIRLKERSLTGLDVDESQCALWEVDSLIAFSRAERIVQARRDAPKDDDDKGQPGRGWDKGDSTAFAWTKEQIDDMDNSRRRRDDFLKRRQGRKK